MINEQIIAILEKDISEITTFKDIECENIKERVMREKVVPLNMELDKLQEEGISELNKLELEENAKLAEEYNAKLSAIKEKYDADRKSISDNYEKKKKDNISSILTAATYEVESKCLKHIAKCKAMIDELKQED